MLLSRTGLARQITIATASLALLCILAAGFMAYLALRAMVHEQVSSSLRHGVEQVTAQVEDRLSDIVGNLHGLAANTLIGNALIDDVGRNTYLPSFLHGFKRVSDLPVSVIVTDFNGAPFATNGFDVEAPLNTEWVASVVARGQGDALLETRGKHPHLIVAAPIIFPNTGRPEGALVYRVHPQEWFESNPLVRSRKSLSWLAGIELDIVDTRDGTRAQMVAGSLNGSPLASRGGFMGSGPLQPMVFEVRLFADPSLLRPPVTRLILWCVIGGMGVLIVAVFLSRLIGRGLAARLNHLQESVAEVMSHEHPQLQFPAEGNDEAAHLAGAFNGMLERLHTAYRELDTRRQDELDQSEARFRSVLEQAGDAIYLIDADSQRILDGNGKAHESLGCTREELLTLTVADLHPAGVTLCEDRARGLPPGGTVMCESVHRRKNGETFPVEVSLGLMQVGTRRFMLSVARDISERRRSEKITRERALIVAQMSDALIVTDLGGYITDWNPGAERIFGYPAAAILGQSLATILGGKTAPAGQVREILAQVVRGAPWDGELAFQRRDGSDGTCAAVLVPFKDEFDQTVAVLGVYRDVTEKKLMERELFQAQKMEAVGQLTGGIAHDFNNLLQVIFGNLELAQRVLPDEKGRLHSYVETAYRAGERGAELTRQLLAFSRKQRLFPRPVDANALITGMLTLLQRTLGERIEVRKELEPDLPLITVDQNALESAILNLAVNAKAAMPDGGELTLTTRVAAMPPEAPELGPRLPAGAAVEIVVRDTGVGMAPEVLQRAFEPFFTTKRAGEGTGLGLSTVYGFVTQSRGHISIESEPGSGTVVHMIFPSGAGAPAYAGEPVQAPVTGAAGGTVLVVEDEAQVRDTVLTMVQACGYQALGAQDAATALRLLGEHPEINLLLTDIILAQGINGLKLARAAKGVRRDLPVLLCTGYSEGELERAEAARGEFQLLRKPYTFRQLSEALHALVHG